MATGHVRKLRHDKLAHLMAITVLLSGLVGSLFGWLVGGMAVALWWVGGRMGKQEMSLMRCARRPGLEGLNGQLSGQGMSQARKPIRNPCFIGMSRGPRKKTKNGAAKNEPSGSQLRLQRKSL